MVARLKDIAQDLGLSVVTISKVLRNHPDIGEQTRKRVLKRMKELNYQPNFAARSLITGRSWTIGLVVPDLLHPFFAQIAKAISVEVRRKGYSLFISSSDEDPALEQEEIAQLLARRVDVMLIASSQLTVESFRQLEEQRVSYILLDRQFPGFESNFVGVDDTAVGVLATTHLIEQGCRRIAHIRGPEVSTAIGRLNGYKQALASHQMASLAGHVVSIGPSGDHEGDKAGYSATVKLLALKPLPDGIFCFNDPVALGTMRAIIDAGLRVPEDIAVVGCGNLSYSDFLRVPLTSVDQNSKMIGKMAATQALKMAESKTPVPRKSALAAPQLVVRASSLRAKR
ncbi:MAG: LacI family DNA-binding transcriptional regulator [Terracidiphilus sp.]|nr:LacI family DNA-binding transcriptional regulator [Terracidiphilus sp.]MDR3798625.1 LacI family DNA-binding transcriptional regulator [Terracidiphilus sp.]